MDNTRLELVRSELINALYHVNEALTINAAMTRGRNVNIVLAQGHATCAMINLTNALKDQKS